MNNVYKKLFEAIAPNQIKHFLSRNKWIEEPLPRNEVVHFRAPPDSDNPEFKLLIPNSRISDGDQLFMQSTITNLADIFEMDLMDLIQQILNPCDIFRLNLTSPETKFGTVPITKTGGIFSNLLDLVIFSACLELREESYYPKRIKEAISLAENARTGPTEFGSFEVVVYMNLPKRNPDEESIPIQRKIMKRIMGGLSVIHDAGELSDSELIVSKFNEGFNANMCDAMDGILTAFSDASCQFSCINDLEWEPQRVRKEFVSIKSSYSSTIKSASIAMKPPTNNIPAILTGQIVQLSRGKDRETRLEERKVRIYGADQDGEAWHAIAYLGEDAYKIACDAHKQDQSIKIEGILEKVGRIWWLTNPHNLSIISS
jgi:hypothetical protein